MDINIGEVLKLVIFVLLALLLLINTVLHAKKTRAACKLDFLNNVLNEKNISTFVLTRRFFIATMPKPFPKIKEENIPNFAYRHTLEELDEVDKTTNRVNFTLGISIFVLSCVLGILFPETVQRIFTSM